MAIRNSRRGQTRASAGTHLRGGVLDHRSGGAAGALADRLAGAAGPLLAHTRLEFQTAEWRHRRDIAHIRKIADVERAKAQQWLRRHVDEVRVDLGLPTVQQERTAKFKASMGRLSAEMHKLADLFAAKEES